MKIEDTAMMGNIKSAARDLITQVENYTTRAGSRSMLLNAKDKLAKILDATENKTDEK